MNTTISEATEATAHETNMSEPAGTTPTDRDITANHPSNHPRPYLIPKAPPPKATKPAATKPTAEKRWSGTDLPPLGTWVKIITKRDTFTGRVVIAEQDRIRLKEGAGYWEIPLQGVQTITSAPDPRDKRRATGGVTEPNPVEPVLVED